MDTHTHTCNNKQVVQHNFLSHRGYKISDDILLVPLARAERDPVSQL